jgi:hypothetical protein
MKSIKDKFHLEWIIAFPKMYKDTSLILGKDQRKSPWAMLRAGEQYLRINIEEEIIRRIRNETVIYPDAKI